MRYKTYRHRYFAIKQKIDLCAKCFSIGLFIGVLIYANIIGPTVAKAKLIDPTPAVNMGKRLTKPQTGQDGATAGVTFTEFKNYVRQIFGDKANLAIAVSQCECSKDRKEFPNCLNSWGTNTNNGEHSVGAFQINLARNGGKGPWVHAAKVPGETIGQKEYWLMNYKQNVMTAFVISKGGKDFSPWSGWTSGCWKTKI